MKYGISLFTGEYGGYCADYLPVKNLLYLIQLDVSHLQGVISQQRNVKTIQNS